MRYLNRVKDRLRPHVARLSERALHQTVDEYPPSFRRKLHERRRLRDAGVELFRQFDWKPEAKRFVEELGFAVPETIGVYPTPEDVDWDRLPEQCVIKPADGHSARAVFPVERRETGWYDLARGRPVTRAQAVAEHRRVIAADDEGRFSEQTMVEEFVPGPRRLPFDWKVHSFYGRPVLTMQIERLEELPERMHVKFWDERWRDVGAARDDRILDATLDPPQRPDRVMEVASAVSSAIDTPFVRVDLFESFDDVLVGEITLCPGGRQRFTPAWDRYLGEAWEDAIVRRSERR